MVGFWQKLGLRARLLLAVAVAIIPTAAVAGVLLYQRLADVMIETNKETLKAETQAIVEFVRIAAQTSVKNRLRGIAEKNLELMEYQWRRMERGEISRDTAIQEIRRLLSSQTIGETGYIYCIDSQGDVVLHPKEGVEGTNTSDQAFIREQVRRKTGYLEYSWQNPDEPTPRKKALYMVHFEPLDWIVGASSYRGEFEHLVAIDDIRESVDRLKVKDSGYAFLATAEGDLLIHPYLEGENLKNLRGSSHEAGQQIMALQDGSFQYFWQNPGEGLRERHVTFTTLKPYGWIVGTTSYTDEIMAPVETLNRYFFWAFFCTAIVCALALIVVTNRTLKPLADAKVQLMDVDGDDFSFRIEERGRGGSEVVALARVFNRFMERLETTARRLREQEELHRTLVETAPDAIFVFHPDGARIEDANQRACDMLGYTRDELIGTDITRYSPSPETGEPLSERARQVFHTAEREGFAQFNWTHQRKSGECFEAAVSLGPIGSEGQSRFVGIVRDISQLLRLQKESEENRRILRLVLDTIPVGVFWKDRDGLYLGCNTMFAEEANLSLPEEIIGKTDRELSWANHIDMFDNTSDKVIETGSPLLGYEEHIDLTNGTRQWTRKNKIPLTDSNGTIIGVMGTCEDITREKEAQLRLQDSENRYRRLYEQAPLGIALTCNGKTTDANQCALEIYGFDREEIIGGSPAFWSPERQPNGRLSVAMADEYIHQAMLGEQTSFEWRGKRKDGKEIDVAVTLGPVMIDGVQHVFSFFRDITKEKQTQQELRQREKLDTVGQLASGVAHDFNNLLSGIVGGAELILRTQPDNPKLKRYTDMILYAANNAADLTNNLLTFARKGERSASGIDLHKTIHETVRLLKRGFDTSIEFDLDLNATGAVIHGDPVAIQGIFMNLSVNARDAMQGAGRIRIASSTIELDASFCEASPFDIAPGSFVEVSVTDTGSGMSESIKQRIFEPFYTTKEEGSGTGLGLAAVYRTVLEHHGFIEVDSKLGVGSTFTIYLPLDQQSATGDHDAPPIQTGEGRVLLVDDDHTLRETTGMLLEELGYEYDSCENGKEALTTFKASPEAYCLVLTDIVMPVMDGLDLVRALRAMGSRIPVVAMTGYAQSEPLAELAGEVKGFVQKPFALGTLSQAIHDASKGNEQDSESPGFAAVKTAVAPSNPPGGAVLVVEADDVLRGVMADLLQDRGYEVGLAASPEEVRQTEQSQQFDILVADLDVATDNDAMADLCNTVAEYTIVTTPRRGHDVVQRALESGAHDFLAKPFPLDLFINRIGIAESHIRNTRRRAQAEEALRELNEDLENRVVERTRKLREEMEARIRAEEESQRQREQLMQAEKLASLGTLVAGIGHEINNPTHFIMLNLPILKGAWEDAMPVLETHHKEHPRFTLRGIPFDLAKDKLPVLYDDILGGAQRIKTIISELKDYARPSQDAMVTVDISRVIDAANTLLAPTIRKHTKAFHVHVDDVLPTITGDPTRIEQIIINLVQNACHAVTPETGKVSLTCRAVEDIGIELVVADNGEGIAQRNLARLTDPFFTTRQSEGGTGLGLAICLRIINDHHGSIQFKSNPRNGTRVHVFLPVIQNKELHAS